MEECHKSYLFQRKQKKKINLKSLFQGTYIRDIKERYNIRNDDDLSELIDIIASNIGWLDQSDKPWKYIQVRKRS